MSMSRIIMESLSPPLFSSLQIDDVERREEKRHVSFPHATPSCAGACREGKKGHAECKHSTALHPNSIIQPCLIFFSNNQSPSSIIPGEKRSETWGIGMSSFQREIETSFPSFRMETGDRLSLPEPACPAWQGLLFSQRRRHEFSMPS